VSELKSISVVATGDSLITMRQSVHSEPRFLEMVELIRGADMAFTNLEMLLHDYAGYPAAECGGTYTRADPGMIEELKWMGFDIVSTANNHSLDYMYGGLKTTLEHIDSAGIPHAGTGLDLAQARQPAYLEMPRGRVALIAAASTFASFGRAGAARRDMHGRPGLNPLRYETWYVVREETLEAVKRVAEEMGLEEVVQPEDAYYFLRHKFVVGDEVGVHTKPHEGDMEGNLEAVRDSARQADWVLFSLHAHEGREGDPERPSEFIEEFARACIDAGAHAFIGHGHHAMRGIEIRDGKPIFYSLGNFIFQNETVMKMPADFYERYKLDPYRGTPADAYDARQKAPPRPGYPLRKWFTEDEKYWLSFIPYMTFEGDKLTELKLHPIELGQTKPRSQRGRPILAEPDLAERILETMQKLSKPYGTEITVEDRVGVVEL
jgi:poly-gamma-glutamate capsule biosynthesis protein CapA/YwtB (metallophosphatase superfamily)